MTIYITGRAMIPVTFQSRVELEDIDAAHEAGIVTDIDADDFDEYLLGSWILGYWNSKESSYTINDLIRDDEIERDLPEMSTDFDIEVSS